jgi:hypothetical protein
LATLALSVSIAGAAQTGNQTPQVHNSTVTGTSAKPPTNPPKGFNYKPKAIKNSGAGW